MRQSPSNPSTVRAGGAYVELTLRDKVTTGMHAVERKLARFSARMNNVANRMLATGAMFATPFIAATVAYAGFEKQMAEVSTMLDKPEQHMQRFSDAVLDMSREFGDSTESVARGLYDILSAAIAPADALAVLSVSAKAAVGGLTDTATAVDAITTILNSFGMEASEANDVADVLFTTVKRGKLQFNDLAQFIGKTTSFAALAGIELTELGAMLATTTRAGLQPEIAVTATRQFIGSIIRPTKESAKLFAKIFGKEMNTRILKTWGGVLGFLKRISKLDTETQAKLFPNVRAAAAALTLTANTEGFEQDLGYMMNRAGAAEEAFKKMAETASFQWNQLKQSVVSVFTTIGEAIEPMVTKVMKGINVVLEAILPWIKANGALFISLVGIVGGLLTVGVAIKGLTFALSGFSFAFTAIKLLITGVMKSFILSWKLLKKAMLAAFAVVTSPALLGMAAGLGAVVLLASELVKLFGDSLVNSFKKAKHDAGQMVEGITAALQTGNIKLAAEILTAGVELVFTEMMKGIKNAWTTWTNELAKGLFDFWTWVQVQDKKAGQWVSEGWSHIRELLDDVNPLQPDTPEYDRIMEKKRLRDSILSEGEREFLGSDPNVSMRLNEFQLTEEEEAYINKSRQERLSEFYDNERATINNAYSKSISDLEKFGKQVNDELTRQLESEIRTREDAIDKKRAQLEKLTAQATSEWEEYKAEKAEEERLAALALPEIDDNKKIEDAIAGVRGALNYAAAIRLGLEAGTNAFENLEERNTKANEKAAETLSGVKQFLETMTGDL